MLYFRELSDQRIRGKNQARVRGAWLDLYWKTQRRLSTTSRLFRITPASRSSLTAAASADRMRRFLDFSWTSSNITEFSINLNPIERVWAAFKSHGVASSKVLKKWEDDAGYNALLEHFTCELDESTPTTKRLQTSHRLIDIRTIWERPVRLLKVWF